MAFKKKPPRFLFIILTLVFILIGCTFYIPPEIALENFKSITLEDPLLVTPEFNTTKIAESLNYVDSEQEELLSVMKLSDQFTSTNFLHSLIVVKKAQDNFLGNKTKQNAETLLDEYDKSIEIYRKDALTLKEKLNKYYPLEKEQPFIYLSSASSNRVFEKDLNLILENYKELRKELLKRKKILEGKRDYKPTIIKPGNIKSDNNVEVIVPHEAFKQIENINYKDDLYLIQTSCFGGNSEEQPIYFSTITKDNRQFLYPKDATNIYYENFVNSNPAGRKFIDKGIDWHLVREGNTYRCNDLEYQLKIIMMDKFLEKYKSKMFNPDEKEAFEQENRVFSEIPHSYKEFMSLADYYQFHYQKEKNTDSKRINELRERYLFIKGKQNDLDLILNTGFYFNNIKEHVQRNNTTNTAAYEPYLYIIRSNYSFSLLNFSSAVWRISEKPNYVLKEFDNSLKKFKTLKELIKQYGQEKIETFDSVGEKDILSAY